MENSVQRLIDAAAKHGQDSDPDHEVGDLQEFLRLAWELMTDEQCERLMALADVWE
jgi:hypothetical protein